MTKEELKQEAREKYHNHKIMEFQGFYNRHYYYLGYLDSAEPREKRIAELEKEIAELDCQKNRNKACYSCANATERCFKNEIGCPCEKYKSYKDENAELKEKVSYLEDNLRVARKDREKLQLDVAKGLKEFVKDYPATALRYLANEKYVEQLTKAKEILEDIIKFQPYIDRDAMFLTIGNDWKEVIFKAEQFIKDSEVKK